MGVRKHRARGHAKTHATGFGVAGVVGFVILLLIAGAVSVGTLVESWLKDLPNYTSADAYLVAEPTEVFDADGNVIASFYTQNRRSVNQDQVSPYVLKGTVDVEDERFYQHNGVDPIGIARAVVAQLTGRSEGASTITQQLVRNTVLSDEQFEQSLKRKVREAYISVEMEKTYSKDQILMMYLNTIYYGNQAYGIEAASITYFNKSAKDLTLNEAATLVGIPNSPTYFDPFTNLDAVRQRRDKVLGNMLRIGDITQEEYDQTVAEPITINPGSTNLDSQGTYPFFTNYVKGLLEGEFSKDTILKSGLKVYTTLDPRSQAAAQDAVTSRMDELDPGNPGDLNASLVAIDPATGYVKAMVGGRDYGHDQNNMATGDQKQPGSSFKVFTLAEAIKDGMNPNILINCNSPLQVTREWKPQNFNNYSWGYISLAKATEVSSNTGYVQVGQAVGIENVLTLAKQMGVDAEIPAYGPSILGGSAGVSPLNMAEAYATLAAGGQHRDAVAITKILDRNGNTVYEHQDSPTQVLDASTAAAVTTVLQGVVDHSGATATAVRSNLRVDQPVAGKTGTTDNADNLWFCGYTPQLAVATWVGHTNSNQRVRIWGANGSPSTTSCVIAARFLNGALADVPRAEFAEAPEPQYKSNGSWEFSATEKGATSSRSYGNSGRRSGGTGTGTTGNQGTGTTGTETNRTATQGNDSADASNNQGGNGTDATQGGTTNSGAGAGDGGTAGAEGEGPTE